MQASASGRIGPVRTATRAVETAQGWQVEVEKIFISGGDHDMMPRILHLVLARSGDQASGVRGLSLFLVPSHDDDGNRLPVIITRIEEKMGLHTSPTCQMTFDAAPAELLGVEGEGLRIMPIRSGCATWQNVPPPARHC
ncbi:acyl-CoA dehydrogenase family protein [Paenirhodobacter populi]|uniref:Acyl-CoA oxidase/dehydrogenase middle domain-containing protein n=1 Tax=Paenirhodobacter populi TaxID=2306993 RepID=A0A443J4G0_9RHOB|nr:acyl-CoA dehydrogenase family protein [Sinirhodobacter populi]RWR15372.1 hypothetical protein D2T33_00400 [Sinirhodobacter populi]